MRPSDRSCVIMVLFTMDRDFINHLSVGPRPVIFEQAQLISFLAGPPTNFYVQSKQMIYKDSTGT